MTQKSTDQTAPAAGKTRLTTVTLEEPLPRGEGPVSTVTVRRPGAGELRGLTIRDIQTGDVNTMLALIPRITDPVITAPEAEALDPVDLLALTGAISGFFYSAAEKAMLAKVMGQIDLSETQTG